MSEIWVVISLEIKLSHIRLGKILQVYITTYFCKCWSPSRRGATLCTQGVQEYLSLICTCIYINYIHLPY